MEHLKIKIKKLHVIVYFYILEPKQQAIDPVIKHKSVFILSRV